LSTKKRGESTLRPSVGRKGGHLGEFPAAERGGGLITNRRKKSFRGEINANPLSPIRRGEEKTPPFFLMRKKGSEKNLSHGKKKERFQGGDVSSLQRRGEGGKEGISLLKQEEKRSGKKRKEGK